MTTLFSELSMPRSAWVIGLTAALAACGGGGGSTDVPQEPTVTTLAGKVIDGYVSGATVCLDLNANQACDPAEPSTTSGAGGAYSLVTTGLDAAAVAGAYVLVTVPASAKDEDDAGLTVAEAGKKGFTMLAPVAAGANTMVSPLTTLVSQQMISGGLSSAQATAAVRSQLGLGTSGTLNVDFKADTSQAGLAVIANVAAVALGELQAAVAQGAPAGSTAQQKLVASLNELAQNIGVLTTTLGVDGNSGVAVAATVVQQAIQASVAALAADASLSIAQAQGQTSGVASTLDALLSAGFGDAEDWSGDCGAGAQGCSVYTHVHLTLGGSGTWRDEKWYSTNHSPFTLQPADSDNDWVLADSGWVSQADGGTYAAQSDGSFRVTGSDFGQAGALGRVRVQDLAGLRMAVAGESGNVADAVFPAGSQGYWFSFFIEADTYRLRQSDQVRLYSGETVTAVQSLAQLVSAFQTPAAGQPVSGTWGWNGLQFSFDGALASQGVVSFWSRNALASLGAGRYELRTVKGQQVLVITQVPLQALTEAATRSSSILGEYGNRTRPLFGVVGGAVYLGTTRAAGTSIDSRPSLNRTALDAMLAARGLCRLPSANGNSVCP